MSVSAHFVVYAPSPELIALCQSQIRLLQQTLDMDWCGVYLTRSPLEENETEAEVITLAEWGEMPTGLTTLPQEESPFLPAPSFSSALVVPQPPSSLRTLPAAEHPLVLPLLYQEKILGVLVARRQNPPWLGPELQKLETISQTLAIACFCDQERVQYQQQLKWQLQYQQRQQEHWHDLLHQIKNPLTALRTFSQLLLKRWTSDPKNRTIVEGIVREGQHLQDLLESFTQEENPQEFPRQLGLLLTGETCPLPLLPHPPLVLTTVNLPDILDPILLAAEAIAMEKNIEISVYYDAALPQLQVHPASLREVLSNLMDNAIKYTPAGGRVTLQTHAHFREPRYYHGLAIADTGYGIAPQDQAHIFERHFRGQQSQGAIPGSGLGLAIVKELMTRMQGKIELISPNPLSEEPCCPGSVFLLWFLRA